MAKCMPGRSEFDEEELSPAVKYEQLGLADALSRSYDYSSACEELALILRRAYSKLPKNVQSLIFGDTLSAFRLLPQVEPSIGIPAANLLVQAVETVLPKQKKTMASSEFKRVVVAQKRRAKVHELEFKSVSSCMHLPFDILLHIFRMLNLRSLVNASSVCRVWNIAAKDNVLWMTLYSIIFEKSDNSIKTKSSYFVDDTSDVLVLKEVKELSINFDWRGAFKRKFIDCPAWRSRPHRAICMCCDSIIWLSAITCDTSHRCSKSEPAKLKIKPISTYMIVRYLLGQQSDHKGIRNKWACSSSDSDNSDSDGSPAHSRMPKLWALPRLIN